MSAPPPCTLDAAELPAALRTHAGDPATQAAWCAAVAPTTAPARDALAAIVAALRVHPAHAPLQEAGCGAVMRLTHNSSVNSAAAAAAGAVRVCVAAITAHSGRPNLSLQSVACTALGNVVIVDAAARAEAGSAGGVEGVLASVREFGLFQDAVDVFCTALSYLLFECPANTARAGALGALPVVLAVLGAHPADGQVQCAAMNLLQLLLVDETQAVQACTTSAARLTVAALQAFPDHEELQMAGCLAIHRMVGVPRMGHAVAAAVHAAGGTAAMLAALRTHAASEAVQRAAFSALGGVLDAVAGIRGLTRAAAEDGIRATVATLRRHTACVEVMSVACYALFSLVAVPGAKPAALAAGVVPAVAAVMAAHVEVAVVQVHCLDVLACLLQSPTQQAPRDTALAVTSSFGAVAAALRAHVGTHEVQEKGCLVLAQCLEVNDAAVQTAAGSAGGMEAAIAALAAHPNDEPVQKNGVMVLAGALGYRLPLHGANVRRAQAAGGVAAVVRATRGATRFPAATMESVLLSCYLPLDAMLPAAGAAIDAAVRAGAVEAVGPTAPTDDLVPRHGLIATKLRAAAAVHDASACAQPADCARCAEARTRGIVCALASCGARDRDGGAKKLLRCGTCRAACYCSAAHQREDWSRHKGDCGAV
jgi:hypothetical protein